MLKAFFKEIGATPNFKEIQLGGGTPSHLFNEQFEQLVEKLNTLVDVRSLDEFTMEIDPRTTTQDNLRFFSSKGVTRISFGVQDFDPEVQKAINRIQPPELIDALLTPDIRKLFTGVNFDLLYGLPKQTRETFRNTLELVKKFAPERVTLLKYAHAPEIRKHMKLIRLLEAGGGDRDARSAARDSGSEHKHGGGRPQRRGVVCAPLWRDAERPRAFACVHAGRGGGAGAAGAGVSQG